VFTPATPKLPRLTLLILAHEWLAAADELDKVGRSSARRRAVHCRAELFRAWGGDPDAEARMLGAPVRRDGAAVQFRMQQTPTCAAEAAALTEPIDVWYEPGTSDGNSRVSEVYATFAALDDDAVAVWGSRFWTAAYATIYGTETVDTLANLDARAIHRAMIGDLAGATRDAAENDELAHHIWYVSERAPLARQLQLYTRSLDIPHDMPSDDGAHDAWWHQLSHVLLRDDLPFAQQLGGRTRDALLAAQAGNGAALAARLPDDRELRDLDLIAVLPRVVIERSVLEDAVRWMVPAKDPLGVHGFPWVNATRAFTRRTVLDLAGDRRGAAQWADIFQRYDRALDDQRTLVALALASPT
jgi:hypothetical protein